MSFPKYPEYKQSDVSVEGNVPSHWSKTALKHLGSYQNGFPFKPDDWGISGRPIIRIAQLTSDAEPNYFAGELDSRVAVDDGELLFSWSANIDSYIWRGGQAWLNQHIFKVIPSKEAYKAFLFYLIKHVAPKLADFDAHGSTMRHIKKESLGENVYVPPLEEQMAIAAFLDRETAKIDELVAEQRRLIELLKEKRQAVISHAVTKGLNPDAPLKPSGIDWLADVPAHWTAMPLKRELAFLTSGSRGWAGNYADNGCVFIRIGNLTRSSIRLDFSDTQRVEVPAGPEAERTLVREGDVLFSVTAYLGSVAVVPANLEASYVSQHVALARLTQNTLLPKWVAYSALSDLGKVWFDSQAYGGTKIQLSLDDIKNFVLVAPPQGEQIKIIDYLDDYLQHVDTLLLEGERAIRLLIERRTALISAAVTGKIDVRGLADAEAA